MFFIISCPASFQRTKRFFFLPHKLIQKNVTLSLLGKKIPYLQLGRSTHLPAKKLSQRVHSPVILSPNIPQKERYRLQRYGIRVFSCQEYPDFLKIHSLHCAIELLSRLPFSSRVLGIIDQDFAHPQFAADALLQLPQVHLFTENLSAAESFSHKMMQEYGAPILYSSNPEILTRTRLIFSPDNQLVCTNIPMILPLAPEESLMEQAVVFHSPVPLLPPSLAGTVDADIPASELLCALYSLERCYSLEKSTCRQICMRTVSGTDQVPMSFS